MILRGGKTTGSLIDDGIAYSEELRPRASQWAQDTRPNAHSQATTSSDVSTRSRQARAAGEMAARSRLRCMYADMYAIKRADLVCGFASESSFSRTPAGVRTAGKGRRVVASRRPDRTVVAKMEDVQFRVPSAQFCRRPCLEHQWRPVRHALATRIYRYRPS